MKKFRIFSTMLGILACLSSLKGQSIEVKAGDESIQITPSGRIFLDGAFFSKDRTELSNGAYLSDARLGLKAKYKDFNVKIDVGFADNEVDIKDVFMQYNLNKNSYFRAGYFVEPYSLDRMESSVNIKFLTASASSNAFALGRRVGVQYIGWKKNIWVGGGLFADADAVSNSEEGNHGYSAAGRFVFNPLQDDGRILHAGLSATYRKADANGFDDLGKPNPRDISFVSRGNTNVDRSRFLDARVTDADYNAKYGLELIAAYGPLYLQTEYFQVNVKRNNDLANYKASGAYAQVGFLATGGDYAYSSAWARMRTPNPKSLEFVLRYNYTDLNDSHAAIYGGRMSDWTFAANYYINKYMMVKLNYSNIGMGQTGPFAAGENINEIQARLQVSF